MNRHRIRALGLLLGITLTTVAFAQGAPQVLWEVPTPSGLANSVQGIDWSPGAGTRVAVGSTDRWVRTRAAGNGAQVLAVLQPHRSGGADQTVYSTDGQYLAVHNATAGLGYRVLRAADGVFLGMLTATLQPSGLIRFAPDSQLLASTGGDGTLSRWRLADFTVVHSVGSGYDRITTTYNFSPDNTYQAGASQGTITVLARANGATVSLITGGQLKGFTPMAFTPDGKRLAAWSSKPNQTTLYRVADGAMLMDFPLAASNEGVVAVVFSPDGTRLVTTGYLPFMTPNGWDQKGAIRFWRVADGALRRTYDARTGLGVTSPIAWSPDATKFVYGTYQGSVVAAVTPAP
jgi:WD40 repeat protein